MSEDHDTPRGSAGSVVDLSAEDKEALLRVARLALHDYLSLGRLPQFDADSPALKNPCATFVTLWRRDSGELRGCRGECQASRALVDSVARMAIAAAVDDSRFAPVTLDEVPELRIEINALTPMEPIQPDDVVVGRHGLMIVRGYSMGLLLPEVPVRYEWTRADFLKGVCRKAGLAEDTWEEEDTQLYGFESEAWAEDE